MARVTSTTGPRRRGRFSPAALAILASWRVRRTWGMLLMIWVGIIAAVMLVCTVPLYIHVTTTAGLRGTITADRESPYVQVHAGVVGLTKKSIQAASQQINDFPQSNLSSYLDGSAQLVLKKSDLPVASPIVPGATVFFTLAGYSIPQVATHVHLTQGKLPSNSALQILITPGTANYLHVQIGSKIIVPLQFNYYDFNTSQDTSYTVTLSLTVSGLYVADATQDAFWHGDDPAPVLTPHTNGPTDIRAHGLISSEALTSYFDSFYKQHNMTNGGAHPPIIDAYWYYRLNTSHLDVTQINDLITGLRSWKIFIFNNFGQDYNFEQGLALTTADISGAVIGTLQNDSIIDSYRSRLEVVNVPSGILMLELAALAIFFVSIMTALLIERQSDTISVLRSRGASSWQIFNLLTIQGLVLTVSALILGPILGLLAANQLVIHVLPSQQQDALNVINTNPQSALTSLWLYALVAAMAGLLAMIGAIVRAIRTDVLTLRRERARSTRRPLWQRLYLDVFAALIALAGYGISLYISSVGGSDTRTQLLIGSPLSLIAPIFLMIAGVLLLLRLFPAFLTLGAQLAARGRGAPALLAMGQMSRAPQQALRLTLLLALACSFAIFSLVFNASQYQRIQDVTDYQVGADFSGYTPFGGGTDPAEQEKAMMQMGGLTSASAGLAGDFTITNASYTSSAQVEYRAVNADSFARTAIWSAHDSSLSLDSLMQQLSDQRSSSIQQNIVPAFVDAATWNALKLTPGAHFLLQNTTSSQATKATITFLALGQIQGLPTTDHSNAFNNQNVPTSAPGGMLLDFSTYQSVYQHQFGQSITLNYIWLHVNGDAASIAHVRSIILANKSAVYVLPLYDRNALRSQMLQDPLYLTLSGELLLGMGTALLLALLGSLLASWLSVRTRLTNFAVLRALGTSLQQLTGMLSWEQGITYGMALILGIVFGVLLIVTVLPSLIFSSVPITTAIGSSAKSMSEFYSIQSTLPVQTVVPLSLIILLAVLVALCIGTLTMMTRAASGPTLSKSLRLNED